MKSKFKKACVALVAGAGLVISAAGGANAIVEGTAADIGSRPYQVSLQSGGEHYCGGSVIDATTIVTAAHCVEGETAAGTTIRAGVTDVTSSAGQDVAVASITPHPQYQQSELADIAIIKLAAPLQLDGNVQALPLASASELAAATTGTVSGWGAVSENGGDSSTLLQADVPLVSDTACARQLGTDAGTETCAGGTGTDSCYGDSGGPLTISTASGPALAGVVSWGEECGGATPGVYADVPGLTNWVNENRGDQPATTEPAEDVTDEELTDEFADGDVDFEFDEEDFDGEFADEDFDFEFDEDFDGEFADEDFDFEFDEDFDGEFADEDFDFEYGGDFDGEFADEDVDFEYGGDFDGEYEDDGDWVFVDEDGSVWIEDDTGDLVYAGETEDYDFFDEQWDNPVWDDYEADAEYDDGGWDDADYDYDAEYDDGGWDDADYDYDAEYDDSDW